MTLVFAMAVSALVSSLKFSSHHIRFPRSTTTQTRLFSQTGTSPSSTGDVLITALNGDQDISVKVVSIRELVQETLIKLDLTPQTGKALGELIVSTLMMGSGLKGEETLQINLVGNVGAKHFMAITDGDLKIRGMCGKCGDIPFLICALVQDTSTLLYPTLTHMLMQGNPQYGSDHLFIHLEHCTPVSLTLFCP